MPAAGSSRQPDAADPDRDETLGDRHSGKTHQGPTLSNARAGAAVTDSAESTGPRRPPESPGTTSDALTSLLALADIAVVSGLTPARPWDVRVTNTGLGARVRREGLVGLGDAYVDGWWDCGALDQFFDRALGADLPAHLSTHPRVVFDFLVQKLRNLQNRRHARSNVESHYDLGNDVFEAMLDPYMQYTCGYWKTAADLDHAQEDKLDLICRKLGLRQGMTLLDLGCGWGGLARFAAERYGVSVVGVNLSTEQLNYARERCRGLPVEFRLHDYRDTVGTFDRVASIGMFEHVGSKNHRTAMGLIHRCLSDDGLALIHFIASRNSFPNRTHSEMAWIVKHIFPGLVLPSIGQIGGAIDDLMVLEDLHNFGAHYDRTLMAWAANFERGWPRLSEKYGPRFARTWRYYLLSAAGAFRARRYHLWQLVLSKHGVRGGYEPVR
jgi:cyclopropane-fatty-acyl-phospholipid synthase